MSIRLDSLRDTSIYVWFKGVDAAPVILDVWSYFDTIYWVN